MISNEYSNFDSCPDTTYLKTLDLERKLYKSRMATMLEEYNVIRKSDRWKNIFFEFFWQRVNSKVPRFLAQGRKTYRMLLFKEVNLFFLCNSTLLLHGSYSSKVTISR